MDSSGFNSFSSIEEELDEPESAEAPLTFQVLDHGSIILESEIKERRYILRLFELMSTVCKACMVTPISHAPQSILDSLLAIAEKLIYIFHHNQNILDTSIYLQVFIDNLFRKCNQVLDLLKSSEVYSMESLGQNKISRLSVIFSFMTNELKHEFTVGHFVGDNYQFQTMDAEIFWMSYFAGRHLVPWEELVRALMIARDDLRNLEISAFKATMDLTDSNFISNYEFDMFCRLFSPWQNLFENWHKLIIEHDGYAHFHTYQEIKRLLKRTKGTIGSYAFRYSPSNPGDWAIGFVSKDRKIHQIVPNRSTILEAICVGEYSQLFASPSHYTMQGEYRLNRFIKAEEKKMEKLTLLQIASAVLRYSYFRCIFGVVRLLPEVYPMNERRIRKILKIGKEESKMKTFLRRHIRQRRKRMHQTDAEDIEMQPITCIGSSDLSQYPWYMGPRAQDQIEQMLLWTRKGTFMVWHCPAQREYVISLSYGQRDVEHFKIEKTENNEFVVDYAEPFNSIPELVERYKAELQFPYENSTFYRAIHSFNPGFQKFLKVKEGDSVIILNLFEEHSSWYIGCLGNQVGLVPISSLIPKTKPCTNCSLYKTLCAFKSNEKNQLSFDEGDIVKLLSRKQEDTGWWLGSINSQIGYFPMFHVKPLKTPCDSCNSYQVIRPFHVENSSFLSFNEDDIIFILDTKGASKGWCTGVVRGKVREL